MCKCVKILLIVSVFLTFTVSCSNNSDPFSPLDTREPSGNPGGFLFNELIGTWQDVVWGGKWIISNDGYYDDGGGWYELYAEIVEKKPEENYFIIHITNHTTDAGQIGKYTKVHWKEYETFWYHRKSVKMSQHWPQTNNITNARLQSAVDVMWWSDWTNR